jgi:hypothetical protein
MQDIIQQIQVSNEEKDIWKNTYGVTPLTLLPNSIISPRRICNPQNLSFGFGSPIAQTKSESSHGYYS